MGCSVIYTTVACGTDTHHGRADTNRVGSGLFGIGIVRSVHNRSRDCCRTVADDGHLSCCCIHRHHGRITGGIGHLTVARLRQLVRKGGIAERLADTRSGVAYAARSLSNLKGCRVRSRALVLTHTRDTHSIVANVSSTRISCHCVIGVLYKYHRAQGGSDARSCLFITRIQSSSCSDDGSRQVGTSFYRSRQHELHNLQRCLSLSQCWQRHLIDTGTVSSVCLTRNGSHFRLCRNVNTASARISTTETGDLLHLTVQRLSICPVALIRLYAEIDRCARTGILNAVGSLLIVIPRHRCMFDLAIQHRIGIHQVQRCFFLDVVVAKRPGVFQSFSGKDEDHPLRRSALLVLNLCLHASDIIILVYIQRNGFSCQCLYEDLVRPRLNSLCSQQKCYCEQTS